MERLAAKPTAGVPQACRGWGETMAAYRFFDNDEVEWSAILEPHWRPARVKVLVGVPRRKATVRRCTCCIRDEGRPLGFADQAVIPNHPELHSLRAGVVSV
jgi:Transposase DNA-binding